MSNTSQIIERILAADKELEKELMLSSALQDRDDHAFTLTSAETHETSSGNPKGLINLPDPESIVLAKLRPVLIIRDNKIIPEFQGPSSEVWKDRIMEKQEIINNAILAVGRIEVKGNIMYDWVGTGWLVDHDIIVTNRHVAETFCCHNDDFSFRIGYPEGFQSSKIDFLEEFGHSGAFEFRVEKVLWMSPSDNESPDIAFLKVAATENIKSIPEPLSLADDIADGDVIVAIGYPAKDDRIPDQKLVMEIFGDVYDKKRLAPGQITSIRDVIVKHDCSTLGGNSGSPLILLKNGKVAGLHFAGLYKEANFALSSLKIKELLAALKAGTLFNRKDSMVSSQPQSYHTPLHTTLPVGSQTTYSQTYEFNIPVKINIEIGIPLPLVTSASNDISSAIHMARKQYDGIPGIVSITEGYRFRNGWITDEKVIAVDVYEKQSEEALQNKGISILPKHFMGFGVDIRNAGLDAKLENMGISLSQFLELPKPGAYRNPSPPLQFLRRKEKMNAVFHVSPDSGWPNLKKFISQVEKVLTATIYEWEAEHISDAIYNSISTKEKKLKMVTQKSGTKKAVETLKDRLGNRFQHQWASVGAGKIVPSAYHIKVATRDDKAFWLSSGNWKNSNQADINPADEGSTDIKHLLKKNREWHAIIEDEALARMFREYIDFDFEEAKRLPLEDLVVIPELYFMISEADYYDFEKAAKAKYFKPLEINNEELDIEAILTPDRNENGSIFLTKATDLILEAKHSIRIENQSFNLLDKNEPQFERFFQAIRHQERNGIKIRIITRDPREFNFSQGTATLQKLLERIKKFDINTDNIRVQRACHTKAIIIDPEYTNAAVLFGSHNLTTSGTLYNRDASLLVKNAKVAGYFQAIFDYDWENLAHQNIDEPFRNVRFSSKEELPQPGESKISLNEILGLI